MVARISEAFHEAAKEILKTVESEEGELKRSRSDRLDRFLLNPWTGIPIPAVVVYVGLYEFVGVCGAFQPAMNPTTGMEYTGNRP